MIATTYNAESLYLFPFYPDWSEGIDAEFSVPSQVHGGLSDREARTPLGETLRVSGYSFAAVLAGTDAISLRNALLAKTVERIAVPFWPGAMPQSDFATTPIPGGLKISFETSEELTGWPDFSTFEIHTGRAPSGAYTVTDRTWTAPLLVGYFADDPSPSLRTDELLTFEASFVEDSAATYALELDAKTFTAGPSLGAATPWLFPLRMDYAAGRSGGANIPVDREVIGQGRERASLHHGGAAARFGRYSFTFGTFAEAAGLIRFFQDRRALTETFWLPAYLADTRLQADVSASATALQVDDAAAFGTHRYVALLDRERVVGAKVDSVVDNTLNLSAAPGAFTAAETSLCALLLARFAKRRLRLTWISPNVGTAEIEFKETRPEYAAASGETAGETLGAVPVIASLYTFTAGEQVWRLTSYERDLIYGGETFTAVRITHGDVASGITLEDAVSIEAEAVDGSPLWAFWRRTVSDLAVKIERAEVSAGAASNGRVAFAGAISKTVARGNQIEAKAVVIGRALDQFVPRGKFQAPCNYGLFSTGCGLDAADWTFSAEVADPGTAGWPYTFALDTFTRDNEEALPAGFGAVGWFAWGVLEFGGQKQPVQASTVISAGEITVTLAGDLDPFPTIGATVKLRPACNGQAGTCEDKFGNFLNWGGHYPAPANLSLVKVSSDVGGGKK